MESLHAAPGCAMRVVQRSDEPISAAKPFRKQGRIIASHRQTAARRRTIERERSDDGVAAGDKGPMHDPQIGVLIASLGQEMERSPIMPDVEAAGVCQCRTFATTHSTGASKGSRARAFARAVSERSSTVIR